MPDTGYFKAGKTNIFPAFLLTSQYKKHACSIHSTRKTKALRPTTKEFNLFVETT
jgi:hypothetical protein